jgi:hypothetical protein
VAHERQESTMQPTPTVSPTPTFFTCAPTSTTRPTISWPGTIGNEELPHSPRAWWMSEWQTPQNWISILTSSGPGARRSKLQEESGARADVAAYASVFSVPPVDRCAELDTAVVIALTSDWIPENGGQLRSYTRHCPPRPRRCL